MSRAPTIRPSDASLFLALLDFAESRAPSGACACALLRGFCIARSLDPVERPSPEPHDPRREPDEPPPGPAHAAALARVPLSRRPPSGS